MSKKSSIRGQEQDDAWLAKSIEEIEGSRWGDPSPKDTPLVAKCLRLRQVPVGHLTPGEMRMLLGQSIGTTALARRVMPVLQADVLVEAELYSGDLLVAFSRALSSKEARLDSELVDAARNLLASALLKLESEEAGTLRSSIERDVRAAIAAVGDSL